MVGHLGSCRGVEVRSAHFTPSHPWSTWWSLASSRATPSASGAGTNSPMVSFPAAHLAVEDARGPGRGCRGAHLPTTSVPRGISAWMALTRSVPPSSVDAGPDLLDHAHRGGRRERRKRPTTAPAHTGRPRCRGRSAWTSSSAKVAGVRPPSVLMTATPECGSDPTTWPRMRLPLDGHDVESATRRPRPRRPSRRARPRAAPRRSSRAGPSAVEGLEAHERGPHRGDQPHDVVARRRAST